MLELWFVPVRQRQHLSGAIYMEKGKTVESVVTVPYFFTHTPQEVHFALVVHNIQPHALFSLKTQLINILFETTNKEKKRDEQLT